MDKCRNNSTIRLISVKNKSQLVSQHKPDKSCFKLCLNYIKSWNNEKKNRSQALEVSQVVSQLVSQQKSDESEGYDTNVTNVSALL